MKLEQVVVGDLGVNCYIVSCEQTKKAAVIDPGENGQTILEKIKNVEVFGIFF